MYLDLIPPPEVCFGGEACGVFREQDGCFCCLLSCGSEEFLKTGFLWPRLRVLRSFCAERRCELLTEWCGHVSAPGLLPCSSSRARPACVHQPTGVAS